MSNLWSELGPDDSSRLARLEALVRDFYDVVFDDAMIGFHFAGKDREKLVQLETQFAARLFGSDMAYEGRSVGKAHRDLNIFGGQFDRRQQILREIIAKHELPENLAKAWLDHNTRLRPMVTGDFGSVCSSETSASAPPLEDQHADIRGRVAIVTGASRGVGRAISLALAKAGCHVVLAAKSVKPHEKLPGTIYTVADEITKQSPGVVALPLKCNVRHEEDILRVIERTRDELGRIDILVNNAGAAWWHPVEETPSRRVDLVYEVNFRASHHLAHGVLPLMKAQNYGHIIQISPPLTKSNMVVGKCAYMVSKFGMTYLTLALHEELKDYSIGAQSLWPVTMVESAATQNLGLGKREDWRSPDIMGDALVAMVQSTPRRHSGKIWLDEDVLREIRGVKDFSSYACVQGATPKPIPW